MSANSSTIGIYIADAAYSIDNANNGPYNCNIGTYVNPGTANSAPQTAAGVMYGVVGDNSLTDSLLINPATSLGVVEYFQLIGAWNAVGSGTTNNAILVENTNSGTVNTVLLNSIIAHASTSQTVPIVDLEAGNYVSVVGSQIVADGNTTVGIGLKLGSGLAYALVSGDQFPPKFGHFADDIIVSGANHFNISSNIIPSAGGAVPLSYTPAGENAVISNNIGLDDACGTVASAATISFTNSGCNYITGTTAVTEISNSAWQNRSIKVIAPSGVAFNTGGSAGSASGGPMCVTTTLAAHQMATADWNPSNQCWTIH